MDTRVNRLTLKQKRAACIPLLGAIALFGAGCGQQGPESADDFPSRPLSIICPWAVGGGTDRCSRIAGDELSKVLGVRVDVHNRAGGAGVTGHAAGAGAKPDGYTLTMVTAEINMMHWRNLTELGPADFEPLRLMNKVSGAIIVREDAPWADMNQLKEAIAANLGKMHASGTAKGGMWHLACAGWMLAAGFQADDIIWVPSEGAAPALQEMIGGGNDVVFCAPAEALTLIDGGKARCLAVLADKRNPQFPDAPTSIEQGVDFEVYGWAGLAVLSKGTPEGIRAKLESALAQAAGSEGYAEAMTNAGFNVDTEDAAGFVKVLERDDIKFQKLLKAAGIIQ